MNPIVAFINHVLAQNAWAAARLKAHAGKTVRIDALPFVLTLAITPEGGVAAIDGAGGATREAGSATREAGGATDIVFHIDPAQLPLMLADRERAMKGVRIEGDAEFAQAIGVLVRELRWDAEEDLSRVIGDVPAYRAMRGLRAFLDWGRDASGRMVGTTTAYLADEAPVLVRRDNAEQHYADVAAVRDACARLEKRIALLEAAGRGDKAT